MPRSTSLRTFCTLVTRGWAKVTCERNSRVSPLAMCTSLEAVCCSPSLSSSWEAPYAATRSWTERSVSRCTARASIRVGRTLPLSRVAAVAHISINWRCASHSRPSSPWGITPLIILSLRTNCRGSFRLLLHSTTRWRAVPGTKWEQSLLHMGSDNPLGTPYTRKLLSFWGQ